MSVASAKPRAKSSGLYETVKIVIQALLLALIVRTFLFQPFNIPSGSMKDTLLIGDYLFVSKYAYGYSRYAFPWGVDLFSPLTWTPGKGSVEEVTLPGEKAPRKVKVLAGPGDIVQTASDGSVTVKAGPLNKGIPGEYLVPEKRYFIANEDGTPFDYSNLTIPYGSLVGSGELPVHFIPVEWFDKYSPRVWTGAPKRGDIVVFKLPKDNSTDYIKRVIGLPGDTIQVTDGVLSINGQPLKRQKVGEYHETVPVLGDVLVERFKETMPSGVSYETLDRDHNSPEDNTPPYVVPQGYYFMMGDNRDNSTDSRFLESVGYVPFENIVGRAEIIFFSIDEDAAPWEFWKWPWTVRWDRMFKLL